MTWQGTGEGTGTGVPAAVRRRVRLRDNDLCQLRYPGCTGSYQDLDHKDNVAARGISRRQANTVDELQCVCRACHKVKTQREAAIGRAAWKRRPERHPGLLP
jgi:5-methylcytosine-specific restriction protein A